MLRLHRRLAARRVRVRRAITLSTLSPPYYAKLDAVALRLVLNLVERVVVGGDAGVVHLETHDDGVAHTGLVDGDDLAVVVEPVRLGAEDLL